LSDSPLLDWSVAGAPFPGEVESGDGYVVVDRPDGMLVGVIDGLGHGREASKATREAIATLTAHAGDPVTSLVQRCHACLGVTRGVVMTLATWSAVDSTMTWLAVGNVEGMLLRARPGAGRTRESIVPRAGVVGYEIPALRPAAHPVAAGDTLILATDGIAGGFGDGVALEASPREIAEGLLAGYGKRTDDALVLVARYRGRRA